MKDLQCFHSPIVLCSADNLCVVWVELSIYSLQRQIILHFPVFTTQLFLSYLLVIFLFLNFML